MKCLGNLVFGSRFIWICAFCRGPHGTVPIVPERDFAYFMKSVHEDTLFSIVMNSNIYNSSYNSGNQTICTSYVLLL